LHLASQNGHVEVVQFLADHGADSTVQSKNGHTPLHLASQNEHAEVVQFLVKHGANPSAQTRVGGLRGIWNTTNDVWKTRGSSSLLNRESRESSSRAA
jgi:ankyrin repeat protein